MQITSMVTYFIHWIKKITFDNTRGWGGCGAKEI